MAPTNSEDGRLSYESRGKGRVGVAKNLRRPRAPYKFRTLSASHTLAAHALEELSSSTEELPRALSTERNDAPCGDAALDEPGEAAATWADTDDFPSAIAKTAPLRMLSVMIRVYENRVVKVIGSSAPRFQLWPLLFARPPFSLCIFAIHGAKPEVAMQVSQLRTEKQPSSSSSSASAARGPVPACNTMHLTPATRVAAQQEIAERLELVVQPSTVSARHLGREGPVWRS